MTKYDEQFKLRVIRHYTAGSHGGIGAVAALFGLGKSQVRRWVRHYQRHGRAGLNKKRSVYDAPFKLEVLERMWQDQLSYQQVAALFDIRCPAHVSKWARQYHAGGVDALVSRPRGRPRRMTTPKPPSPLSEEARTLEELRKENEYLRAENAYLKKLKALVQAQKPAAPKKRKS